jgi:hypothetical protein
MEIDISRKDKAEVLAALYNAAHPLGLGILQFDPTPMTVGEARKILSRTTDFDYLKGRVMKVDLSGDKLETWLYDRDNGEGTAERVLSKIANY